MRRFGDGLYYHVLEMSAPRTFEVVADMVCRSVALVGGEETRRGRCASA